MIRLFHGEFHHGRAARIEGEGRAGHWRFAGHRGRDFRPSRPCRGDGPDQLRQERRGGPGLGRADRARRRQGAPAQGRRQRLERCGRHVRPVDRGPDRHPGQQCRRLPDRHLGRVLRGRLRQDVRRECEVVVPGHQEGVAPTRRGGPGDQHRQHDRRARPLPRSERLCGEQVRRRGPDSSLGPGAGTSQDHGQRRPAGADRHRYEPGRRLRRTRRPTSCVA